MAVGIGNDGRLAEVFERFRGLDGFQGVLVEEMLSGIELILGAKIDLQFGPMILLGMGGTGVEIYQDVALRMAPLTEKDALAMIEGLKAHRLLEGYRGAAPVDRGKLTGNPPGLLCSRHGTGGPNRIHRHQSASLLRRPLRGGGRPHHPEEDKRDGFPLTKGRPGTGENGTAGRISIIRPPASRIRWRGDQILTLAAKRVRRALPSDCPCSSDG